MVALSCGPLFKNKPVETCRVETVDRRPAVESFANIGGGALLTSMVEQVAGEALLGPVMDLRHPHDHGADAPSGHRQRRLLRNTWHPVRAQRRHIVLGSNAARDDRKARCDDQWLVRSRQPGAKRL